MKKVRHRSKLYKNHIYKRKKQKERREEWESFLGNVLDHINEGKTKK